MSAARTWVELYGAQAAGLPGAHLPWLATTRKRAIERFAGLGWPTNRMENWRHTSLAVLEQQSFVARTADDTAQRLVAQLRDSGPGHWLVFVDGHHAPALSALGELPDGVQVGTLAATLAARPEAIEAVFGAAEDGEAPAALNAALATDGAYIHVARGVALEAPVHLVFVGGVAQGASQTRNLIVAEAAAQLTVVEHYVGRDGAATLTNAVTRIRAGADAHVTHLKLQQEPEEAFHIAAIEVAQARGSVFNSHSLSFGAKLARNDINTRFEGEGGEALLNGLYHADGRRHVDHHTWLDHAQPGCTSREFYRGILDGTARGVFTGRVYVAPGAMRTDAIQRNDNLLLSKLAEADSRPELEIYADDVQCAHGATVGQIDENSLFYLRSRGLDEAHARNLLIYAFAAEVLGRIGVESLRKRAEATIRARIPGGALLEETA